MANMNAQQNPNRRNRLWIVLLSLALLGALGGSGFLLWQSNPQKNEALDLLLQKYIEAGQYGEAFGLLNQALTEDPTNQELQLQLEDLLAIKQQSDREREEKAERAQQDANNLLLEQNAALQNRTELLQKELVDQRKELQRSQRDERAQNPEKAAESASKSDSSSDSPKTQNSQENANLLASALPKNIDNTSENEAYRRLAEARKEDNGKLVDQIVGQLLAKNPSDIRANAAKAKRVEQRQNEGQKTTPKKAKVQSLKAAESAYREALEETPQNRGEAQGREEALAGLAQNLDEQGQLNAAVAAYDAALEQVSDPFDSELAYLRGIALYRLERYSQAVASFEEYLNGGGTNLRAYYGLGLSYGRLRRLGQAAGAYQKGLAKGLRHAPSYWELSKIELEQGNSAQALKNVGQALALKSNDSRYLRTRGAILFALERYKEAANAYELAEKAGVAAGERGRLEYNKGVSYYNSGDYAKAEKALAQAVSLDAGEVSYILGQADTWVALGKYQQAERSLATAAKKFPNNVELLLTQGNIYLQQKQYDQALAALQNAYRRSPQDSKVINSLGLAYMNTERFAQSREVFRKALANDSRNDALWFNLALVDLATDEYGEAAQNLEQAISLNSELHEAYYLLTKAYLSEGQREQAEGALRRLRNENPSYPKIAELEQLLSKKP